MKIRVKKYELQFLRVFVADFSCLMWKVQLAQFFSCHSFTSFFSFPKVPYCVTVATAKAEKHGQKVHLDCSSFSFSQQQAKARLKKNTRPGGSLTLELMLFALHINNNLYWLSRYCLEVHIWFSPILALEFNICLTLAWIFPFTPSSIFIKSSRLLNKNGSILQVYFINF